MHWEIIHLRGVAYSEVEKVQQSLRERVAQEPTQAFLLFSEPTPTLTGGISASSSDLLWPLEAYAQQGVVVERVHRGGKWTYHGPGQIVVYPIFKLSNFFPKTRVRGYLQTFQRALLLPLQKELKTLVTESNDLPFGIYHENPGTPSLVKLASFGVAIRAGITAHGAAVYHSGNQAFAGVVACGLPCATQTSLTELSWHLDWEKTAELFAQSLVQEFETAHVKGFSS